MSYIYKAMLCVRVCVFIFNCSIVVIQSLSHVQLFSTPWLEACQGSLSFTISQSWLKLMSFVLVVPSNYLIFCHPILLSRP